MNLVLTGSKHLTLRHPHLLFFLSPEQPELSPSLLILAIFECPEVLIDSSERDWD